MKKFVLKEKKGWDNDFGFKLNYSKNINTKSYEMNQVVPKSTRKDISIPLLDDFIIEDDVLDIIHFKNDLSLPQEGFLTIKYSQNPFKQIIFRDKLDVLSITNIPTFLNCQENKNIELTDRLTIEYEKIENVMDEIIFNMEQDSFYVDLPLPFNEKNKKINFKQMILKNSVFKKHLQLATDEKEQINTEREIEEIEEVIFDNEIINEFDLKWNVITMKEEEEGWERIKKETAKWIGNWRDKKDLFGKLKNQTNILLPSLRIKDGSILFPYITKKFYIEEYNLTPFEINVVSFKEKYSRRSRIKMLQYKEFGQKGEKNESMKKVDVVIEDTHDFEIEESEIQTGQEDKTNKSISIDSSEMELILEEMKSITSKISKKIENKNKKEEKEVLNKTVQLKNPKEELEKAKQLLNEASFHLSYSKELKELYRKRQYQQKKNERESKFKKKNQYDNRSIESLVQIGKYDNVKINIEGKIKENIKDRVNQYFKIVNENKISVDGIDDFIPWNNSNNKYFIKIPINVIHNLKKMYYTTSGNDIFKNFDLTIRESKLKRNIILSPSCIVSIISTEINSIMAFHPNAKFVIYSPKESFSCLMLLIQKYLKENAKCSFQTHFSKKLTKTITFVDENDDLGDVLKECDELFCFNKCIENASCFNYVDHIDIETMQEEKDTILKGFKTIRYELITTQRCPVKENLLEKLMEKDQQDKGINNERNPWGELIHNLMVTDQIETIISQIPNEQEFEEIITNYYNGITIESGLEEIINKWIDSRNTKLFDVISFNPLIKTKMVEEIEWSNIKELLVIFPNDLHMIGLIGEICTLFEINITIIRNSIQQFPRMGSIALSQELLRTHIKNISSLKKKMKSVLNQKINKYLPPIVLENIQPIKCIVSESLVNQIPTSSIINFIYRNYSIPVVFCSFDRIIGIINFSHFNWKNDVKLVFNYSELNQVGILIQTSLISTLQHFNNLYNLFATKHCPIFFLIEETTLHMIIQKWVGNQDKMDWIIEKESIFEHLLNQISFLHPFISQFLLSNFSLRDLCTSSSFNENIIIPNSLMSRLNQIFTYQL